MNGISAAAALDLVATTLNEIPRGSFTQTLALNAYPVCDRIFGSSGRITADGGQSGREWRIRLTENESARGTRLYATQTYNQVDVMATLVEPWYMHEASYLIETAEVARNRGAARIVKLVKTRRDACYESIANFFERRGLLCPDSASDDLNPRGLLFHCRGLAAGQVDPVGGFNGTTAIYRDGTTTSLVGGLDATIAKNARLRNWAFTHNGAMDPGLLRQLRTAIMRVGFRPPRSMKLDGPNTVVDRSRFTIFWQQAIGEAYSDLVNTGPDDRNGNASPFWGDLPFGPVETVSTPALDNESNVPILGVNHNTTRVCVMSGQWLVEDEPIRSPTQRRLLVNGIDSQYTITNDNPRVNFIGHTPR